MTGFDFSMIDGEGLGGVPLVGRRPVDEPGRTTAGESTEFGSALSRALEEVGRLGDDAKDKAQALARGEPVEVHDLMIALGKSEVAFNLMLEVRNKMVEAWQVLSRSVM